MTPLVDIFVPIAFFAMIVLIVYFSSKFSFQTKKAILEKGGSIEVTKKKFPLLELGLTALGIGLGLGLSVIPMTSNLPADAKNLLVAGCIVLFGGLGLVSAFFLRKKLDERKK